MLKFIATTEIEKILRISRTDIQSHFPDLEIYQSSAALFETEGSVVTNNKEANQKWTRVSLR